MPPTWRVPPNLRPETVEFERVIPWKEALLRKAFGRFHENEEFENFRDEHANWLPGYARFMALKAANGGRMWTEWDAASRARPGGSRAITSFCSSNSSANGAR